MMEGEHILPFQGKSMWPFLKESEQLIVIDKKSSGQHKVGQVVVLKDNEQLLVHRIVDVNNNSITTKGDFSNNCETIDAQQILFQVIGKLSHKKKKYFNNVFSSLVANTSYKTYAQMQQKSEVNGQHKLQPPPSFFLRFSNSIIHKILRSLTIFLSFIDSRNTDKNS